MRNMKFYSPSELRPRGWMRRQLEIQAEGLSGNLDKIWRDVRDSAWIGGDADGWERVPYWLDGFIPLAYLLDREDMKDRAKKYIDAILKFQKPDGWICPCEDDKRGEYDPWAIILISKTLSVYYDCSGDERIPRVIYNVLYNFYTLGTYILEMAFLQRAIVRRVSKGIEQSTHFYTFGSLFGKQRYENIIQGIVSEIEIFKMDMFLRIAYILEEAWEFLYSSIEKLNIVLVGNLYILAAQIGYKCRVGA